MNNRRKKELILSLGTLVVVIILAVSYVLNSSSSIRTIANREDVKMPIHSVNTDKQEIALSFDINWAEKDYLDDILIILNKYNVKATFFVMGKWITYTDDNKEKLNRIKEGGHEIGNHSYIHPNFSKLSNEKIEEEIMKTEKIIKDTVGVKSKLFRFPSGDYSESAVKKVLSLDYMPIQWDADSVDWKEDGETVEYERVRKKVKSGSIMLFHNNAKHTPSNLEKLIKELQSEGYEFKKVGDIIYNDGFYIDSLGTQHKNL